MSLFNNSDLMFAKEANKMLQQFETFSSVSPVICSLTICIVLVIGMVGNALVIYITLTTQRVIKHPVHSMLVLNLAVADIVYLTTSGPYQALAYTYPGWIFGHFLCPAFHYFNIATMSVSIFTMCALAWMRFMALMLPFRFQRSFLSTKKAGVGVVIAVWIFAALLATPTAVHFRLHSWTNETIATNVAVGCVWQDNSSNDAYAVAVLVITYVIPFLLVTIFYFFVGREIFCYMRSKARSKSESNNRNEQAEFTRTTVMVLCLIVAFLICWFPYHLGKMMIVSKKYEGFEYAVMMSALELTGYCMSYMHACVNPIIYTFAAPGFRRSLRKTIAADNCEYDSWFSLFRSNKRKSNQMSKKSFEVTTAPTNNERTCISRLASPILPDRDLSTSHHHEVKALVSGNFLTVEEHACKEV